MHINFLATVKGKSGKDIRTEIANTATAYIIDKKWKDGKAYGYKSGVDKKGHSVGDGSKGYFDCSNFVHQVYKDAGMDYSYLNVYGIMGSTRFREVLSKKAKIGDLIVFVPYEGNTMEPEFNADKEPEYHTGIVTEVDSNGKVVSFVNAATHGGYAKDRKSKKFLGAIIEYKPRIFQTKASQDIDASTWRVYRWKN